MTSNQSATDPLSAEITRVNQLTRAMIDEYVSWRSKIVHGEIDQFMYSEMLDFVNFRIETVDTCLLLIENCKIADALGLSRSLFENYLLLMLMCRGTKYFKLRDLSSSMREAEFKAYLEEQKAELSQKQVEGKTTCLYVRKYRGRSVI